MSLVDLLRLSFKNLKKKKVRTFINLFSVSIGAMLIITLVSLGAGLQNHFQEKTEDLYSLRQVKVLPIQKQADKELNEKLNSVNTEGELELNSIFKEKAITDDFISHLTSNEKIEEVLLKYEEYISEIEIDGKKLKDTTISHYNSNRFLKIEEENLKKINSKERIQIPLNYISKGKDILDTDTASVLINEELASITFGITNLDEVIGKEIILTSNVAEYDLSKKHVVKAKVVGIIDHRYFQPSIIVSNDIMTEFKNFYKNNEKALYERPVDLIDLSVKNIEDVPTLISEIENDFKYTTESVQLVASTMNNALNWLKIGLGLIGAIVIFISALNVINTMVSAVNERTKSIGLMKAIGSSNLNILKLFVIEGSIIGFLGSLLGLLFSMANIEILKTFITDISSTFNLTENITGIIQLDSTVVIFTILFATILTVIASLYPSIMAFRLDPINALKK